ncbi:MAG: FHA domain-containing protein, partial [bacterium]
HYKSEMVVTVNRGRNDERQLIFSDSFRIGRGDSCEVQLPDDVVSAHHLEILNDGGKWWLHDLHSTNGTFLDGELIHKVQLADRATLQLGKGGPIVSLKIKSPDLLQTNLISNTLFGTIVKAIPSSTQIYLHYFSPSAAKSAGHYTLFLRKAFDQALKKKAKKFLILIGVVSIFALSALTFIWFQHKRLAKLEPLGMEIFYTMKALELQIANLTTVVGTSSDKQIAQDVTAMRQKYWQLQKKYDRFVKQLGVYDESVNEKDRLILRMARTFGECELNAPEDFVDEVKKYIKKWQSSDRLQKAIQRSLAYGYPKNIADIFLKQQLPPQFIYLALQESDFDVNRIGPKTRYGIAKGMWQFIPRTGAAYGLKIGPLRNYPRSDPRDERHNFEKSTTAAAKLIRDLYNTKAQGSGLLVLASYNWGIGNLGEIIDKMPPNPKERNFWNLVKKYKIPQQT